QLRRDVAVVRRRLPCGFLSLREPVLIHSVGCIPCVLRSYFLLMIFLEEIFRMAVQDGKAGCDHHFAPLAGGARWFSLRRRPSRRSLEARTWRPCVPPVIKAHEIQ